MKQPLLLLLLLPLHAFAQYRPMYTPSRPSYTPRYTTSPSRSTTSLYSPTSPYQTQLRQQQYAHQQFQQQQARQLQQLQDWHRLSQQQAQARWQQLTQRQQLALHRQTPQQLADAQARQQQAEQQATEQLAHLAQEQQRQRAEHPTPDAQQAAQQQRADARQLNVLAVRNYQRIFLPGQVLAALQSQLLSGQAQQQVHALTHELRRNSWWKQQAGPQLAEQLAAHRATLAALTRELQGTGPAAPAAAAPAATRLTALLAADKFDGQAAGQLLREAAQADKLAASQPLAAAIQQFEAAAQDAQRQPGNSKALRKQVQASARRVGTELARYQAHVGAAGQLFQTQRSLTQATADYLATNDAKPSTR